MASRYDQAEVLTALWKLGAADNALLPTSHGILDRALKDCLDQLPDTLREGLSFGVTGVGLRCYELPGILLAAQEALLTSEPNPTYLSSMVTLEPYVRLRSAIRHITDISSWLRGAGLQVRF